MMRCLYRFREVEVPSASIPFEMTWGMCWVRTHPLHTAIGIWGVRYGAANQMLHLLGLRYHCFADASNVMTGCVKISPIDN